MISHQEVALFEMIWDMALLEKVCHLGSWCLLTAVEQLTKILASFRDFKNILGKQEGVKNNFENQILILQKKYKIRTRKKIGCFVTYCIEIGFTGPLNSTVTGKYYCWKVEIREKAACFMTLVWPWENIIPVREIFWIK